MIHEGETDDQVHPPGWNPSGTHHIAGPETVIGIRYISSSDRKNARIDQRNFRWRLKLRGQAILNYNPLDVMDPPAARVRLRLILNGTPISDIVANASAEPGAVSLTIPLPYGASFSFPVVTNEEGADFYFSEALPAINQENEDHGPNEPAEFSFPVKAEAWAYTYGFASSPRASAGFDYYVLPTTGARQGNYKFLPPLH